MTSYLSDNEIKPEDIIFPSEYMSNYSLHLPDLSLLIRQNYWKEPIERGIRVFP